MPPITLSKLGFEIMTLGEGGGDSGGLKRRTAFGSVWPVPATTSNWPAVVYRGPDGKSSTASPTEAFPTPPPSIGPGAAPPQMGTWPGKALVARAAAAVDPNAEIEEGAKSWLCQLFANNPSYWDLDIPKECTGYGGNPGIGEIPMGPGWAGAGTCRRSRATAPSTATSACASSRRRPAPPPPPPPRQPARPRTRPRPRTRRRL